MTQTDPRDDASPERDPDQVVNPDDPDSEGTDQPPEPEQPE